MISTRKLNRSNTTDQISVYTLSLCVRKGVRLNEQLKHDNKSTKNPKSEQ